jgi:hypothetical protein
MIGADGLSRNTLFRHGKTQGLQDDDGGSKKKPKTELPKDDDAMEVP